MFCSISGREVLLRDRGNNLRRVVGFILRRSLSEGIFIAARGGQIPLFDKFQLRPVVCVFFHTHSIKDGLLARSEGVPVLVAGVVDPEPEGPRGEIRGGIPQRIQIDSCIVVLFVAWFFMYCDDLLIRNCVHITLYLRIIYLVLFRSAPPIAG